MKSWSLGSGRDCAPWVSRQRCMQQCMRTPLKKAVKMVMDAMAQNRHTLVYCRQGLHHSGCFVIFVTALIEVHRTVSDIMETYLEDPAFEPDDCDLLRQLWFENGLWDLLDGARTDPEIQSLVAKITPKLIDEATRTVIIGGYRSEVPPPHPSWSKRARSDGLFPQSTMCHQMRESESRSALTPALMDESDKPEDQQKKKRGSESQSTQIPTRPDKSDDSAESGQQLLQKKRRCD